MILLKKSTGEKAVLEMYPMQAGDVNRTWTYVHNLKNRFGYNPNYPVDKDISTLYNGIKNISINNESDRDKIKRLFYFRTHYF